ncbi:GTPase IMAP family member 6-like [Simochromis diagramma]|uniref:GTPase IMAP family member 6-like n=1 Tax=Simochromis diagramma TaxID=43689 RepID=UPI001A7E7D5D|nr:GTPase IMAP family member 6-like [Simochromis diagramma]
MRAVLMGNSWSKRSTVGNFILEETVFNCHDEADLCLRVKRELKGKEIDLINTPDLLSPKISPEDLTKHVENCVRLSAPGPHVFLLVFQPADFTEDYKERLQMVLELFGDPSLDRALVLIMPKDKSSTSIEKYLQHPQLGDIIKKCSGKLLWQNLEHEQLLAAIDTVVKKSMGEDVSREETSVSPSQDEEDKVPANLDPLRGGKAPTEIQEIVLPGEKDNRCPSENV